MKKDEIQRSEDRYLHLLEAVGDYIYTVYIEDGCPVRTIHGSKCEAVTGYMPSEYEATPFLWCGMIYEADRNAVTEHVARLLRGEAVPPVEHRIIRKDGSIRWVRNTALLRYDENGKVIAYDGLIEDITERKKVEEDIKESEERFRSTLESMLEGCQIIGYDWRYLFINDSAAIHGKLKKEELLGHTMMESYAGIEKTDMFAALRRCMNERIPHRMENEFIYTNGSKAWFLISIQPVSEGIFILSLDITERKKAEEELAKHVDELERYMKATIKREDKVKELWERVKRLEGELRKVER